MIPGFNAHSDCYEWVANQFVADRLAAYAPWTCGGRGDFDGEQVTECDRPEAKPTRRLRINAIRDLVSQGVLNFKEEPGDPSLQLRQSGSDRR